jgi:hypothetical protein
MGRTIALQPRGFTMAPSADGCKRLFGGLDISTKALK